MYKITVVALIAVLANMFVQERRTVRMMYQGHKKGRCFPPHCSVCDGSEWPDGTRRGKSLLARVWQWAVGVPHHGRTLYGGRSP